MEESFYVNRQSRVIDTPSGQVQLQRGEIFTAGEVRQLHRASSSFPEVIEAHHLHPLGYSPITALPQPDFNPATHRLQPKSVDDEGHWTRAWVAVPLTSQEAQERDDAEAARLAAERTVRAAMIRAERDRRRAAGVLVGGRWFKSDMQAVMEYAVLASLGAAHPTAVLRANWRTMAHTSEVPNTVDMTAQLAGQILAAGFAAVAAIDDASEKHLAAVATADTPELYDFSAGWPLVYSEPAPTTP